MASSVGNVEGSRELLLRACKVSREIKPNERPALDILVEASKAHLKSKALALLEESQDEAVLWVYSCDATPLKLATTTIHGAGDTQVIRKGKKLEELLLQRGLLKTKDSMGGHKLAMVFGDIVPLSRGKRAPNVFPAGSKFFPLLRTAGHMGYLYPSQLHG